jgi:hypothetical protein
MPIGTKQRCLMKKSGRKISWHCPFQFEMKILELRLQGNKFYHPANKTIIRPDEYIHVIIQPYEITNDIDDNIKCYSMI